MAVGKRNKLIHKPFKRTPCSKNTHRHHWRGHSIGDSRGHYGWRRSTRERHRPIRRKTLQQATISATGVNDTENFYQNLPPVAGEGFRKPLISRGCYRQPTKQDDNFLPSERGSGKHLTTAVTAAKKTSELLIPTTTLPSSAHTHTRTDDDFSSTFRHSPSA